MKKELKDYLHLYLGCDMYSEPQQGEYFIEKLTGVEKDCIMIEGNIEYPPYDFKPILRPLNDITKSEESHIGLELKAGTANASMLAGGYFHSMTPKVFHFLLSKRFDLFGLIEAGLAIDIKTLK